QDKRGMCPPADVDVTSCPYSVSDRCFNDADCRGNRKCCFTGCHMACLKPMKKKHSQEKKVAKLGTCPAPTFSGKPYLTDMCSVDLDCPGKRRCCYNGCNHECLIPIKLPMARPKPGICPVQDGICDRKGDMCSRDSDCTNDWKCCFNGCQNDCIQPVTDVRPDNRSADCPAPWKGLDGICDRMGDQCQSDIECRPNQQCCFNGCQKQCIKPGEVVRPDNRSEACPAPWKGLDGICDRMGDQCKSDSECRPNQQCCFNGCQKQCIKPGEVVRPDNRSAACPAPWKGLDGIYDKYCDRMGDLCKDDKDCFGNFKCCFTGCQYDCVKPG
ncbi:predicted protein, partial [Nematostella vectensis]